MSRSIGKLRVERVEVVTESGERVDITDMEPDDYESFLDFMRLLRAAYNARKNAEQTTENR